MLEVIAGQGTMGLELLEQVREMVSPSESDSTAPLDAVIIPIGGGGMCAGVATVCWTVDRYLRMKTHDLTPLLPRRL